MRLKSLTQKERKIEAIKQLNEAIDAADGFLVNKDTFTKEQIIHSLKIYIEDAKDFLA